MALRAARRSWTSPVTRCGRGGGRAPRRARVRARARRASEASEGTSEGVWGVQGAADAAWEAAGRDEAARAKAKDAQRRKDVLRAAAAGETARAAEGGRKGATVAQKCGPSFLLCDWCRRCGGVRDRASQPVMS